MTVQGGPILDPETRRAAFEARPARRRGPVVALGVAGFVALCVVGAVLGRVGSGSGRAPAAKHPSTANAAQRLRSIRAPGAATVPGAAGAQSLPSSLAGFMDLQTLPGTPAPEFTLTDQHGRSVSLQSMRGNVVVLGFASSGCSGLCPVLAAELLAAHRDLGAAAARVDFLTVNVDVAHPRPAAGTVLDRPGGLAGLADWHYLTGTPAALQAVWKAYGITVARAGGGQVVDTSLVYLIDPGGAERYQASPYANQQPDGTETLPPSSIARYGQGIARYASQLLR
ncbi:MAG: SCO family protein [Acidimicrobiales bacterium]